MKKLAAAALLTLSLAFGSVSASEFSGGEYVEAPIPVEVGYAVQFLTRWMVDNPGLSQEDVEDFKGLILSLSGQVLEPDDSYLIDGPVEEFHFSGGDSVPVADPNYVPTGGAALLINLLTKDYPVTTAVVDMETLTIEVRGADVINRTSKSAPKVIDFDLEWNGTCLDIK